MDDFKMVRVKECFATGCVKRLLDLVSGGKGERLKDGESSAGTSWSSTKGP